MATTLSETLRRRVLLKLDGQRELVQELLRQREQLPGSLFARYGECGKESCVCHTGRKHGPYYVLSTRTAGRGGFAYLTRERLPEARELVRSYRAFKRGLAQLRKSNLELVSLLKRYQASSTRLGSHRVGMVARA